MTEYESTGLPKPQAPSFRRVLVFLLIAIGAGAIYGLAWRSNASGPWGLIGLGLFFYQQYGFKRWWSAVAGGLVTGSTAYLIACPWFVFTYQFLSGVYPVYAEIMGRMGCVVQGGHFALFALLWYGLRNRFPSLWIAAPALWVVIEQCWPGLFPCLAGNLLVESQTLSQIASLGGAILVSFQAAMMAGGLAVGIAIGWQAIRGKPWRADWLGVFSVASLLLVLSIWFGVSRIADWERVSKIPNSEQPLRVLVFQVDTEFDDSRDRMIEVCQQFKSHVDLVVWPECAFDEYPQSLTDFRQLSRAAEKNQPDSRAVEAPAETSDSREVEAPAETNETDTEEPPRPYPEPIAPLLAGGDSWISNSQSADGHSHFVSAFLLDEKEQVTGRHDKVNLMPYGETIPGESWLPILRTWFGSERIITRGIECKPIGTLDGVSLGVALCCEDMHSYIFREMTLGGANVLVTLGNGMAFDSEVALRQHFRIAQLRAIENGRYFLRCTSHGVTGLLSPIGEMIEEFPAMQDRAAVMQIPKRKLPITFFTQHGAAASYGSVVFCTLLFWIAIMCCPRSVRDENRSSFIVQS
jgi:apolipoprotein N-acyltransferase